MPTDPPRIRPATLDDAPGMATLAAHLGYPTSGEEMRERLALIITRDEYHTLVAEHAGRLVGFGGVLQALSYTYSGPSMRLLALVVDPAERGRGIGAALLDAAEDWARARGATQIHLTTALHREGAQRFYAGRGYEPTGLRYVKKLG